MESKKEVSSVLFFMLSDDIETIENEMLSQHILALQWIIFTYREQYT